MKWLQSIFRSEAEIRPTFKALLEKFDHFLGLLEKNNQVLKIISDMEEKAQGEYLFDLNYILARVREVRAGVSDIVEKMIALGGPSYVPLRDRLALLDGRIEELLPGTRPVVQDHFTIPLDQAGCGRAASVGGKNTRLGEMRSMGLPVPDGFAISAWAYHYFMETHKLQDRIDDRLQSLDLKSLEQLEQASAEIQSLVRESAVPKDLASAIAEAIEELERRTGAVRFALRSSAVGEDAHFSFAGQYATFLNLRPDQVLDHYREILASKFSPKAIYYFLSHGLRESDLPMSVGCMVMVDAASSGVIYTRDPISGSTDDSLTIHSLWGLGPYVMDGTLTPDLFRVRRKDGSILEATPSVKSKRLVAADGGGVVGEPVPLDEQAKPSLRVTDIEALRVLALKVEDTYGSPGDIEWAIDREGRPFVLQARPLRTLAVRSAPTPAPVDVSGLHALISGGTTVCPGAGGGPVYHASSTTHLTLIPEGVVLVTPHPLPGLITALGRVSALVTQVGGAAGHMATIAREYRIPTLAGVESAGDLPPGIEVTVDATEAVIYRGLHEDLIHARQPEFELLADTEIMMLLRSILAQVSPLNLLNPADPLFTAESCRTFHDLTRFAHQKAMEEMFSGARNVEHKNRVGLRLKSSTIPLTVDIISIDRQPPDAGGRRFLEESEIASLPMAALWEGIKEEGWPKTSPADVKGFMTVMANNMLQGAESEFSENSYAVLSRQYMLLSLRMGYHFTTIEALCTETESKNYIRVQYKAGGAPLDRRLRRIRVLAALLTPMGFESSSKGDFLEATITYEAAPTLLRALRQLGRISMMTKQLDMALSNDSIAHWYMEDLKKRLHLTDNGKDP
jgi:pyruvate,water dikinase